MAVVAAAAHKPFLDPHACIGAGRASANSSPESISRFSSSSSFRMSAAL
jgi:hypothetical protein